MLIAFDVRSSAAGEDIMFTIEQQIITMTIVTILALTGYGAYVLWWFWRTFMKRRGEAND